MKKHMRIISRYLAITLIAANIFTVIPASALDNISSDISRALRPKVAVSDQNSDVKTSNSKADDRLSFNRLLESKKDSLKSAKDELKNKRWASNVNIYSRLIIKYKDGKTIKAENITSSVKSKLKLSKLNRVKIDTEKNIEILEIGKKDKLNDVLNELAKDNNIEYVQPDYTLYSLESPASAAPVVVSSLENTSESVVGNGLDIALEQAWEQTKGLSLVLVGITDTAIDTYNLELQNNIYTNVNEIADNVIDDDGNGYIDDTKGWDFYNDDNDVTDSMSTDGHGTHVTGIIAAKENGMGIIGVSPYVKILPLKFMQNGYGSTSDAIEAIKYAESMGVTIMNCSWGSENSNYALMEVMADSDILFVCSAGNEGKLGCMYPAAFDLPNVVSVGAVTNTGSIYLSSNYGPLLDVFAEGQNISSSLPNNMIGTMSGTSVSTAFVTSAAALIKSYHLEACAEELKARIIENTTPNTFGSQYQTSAGILNINQALLAEGYEYPVVEEEINEDEIQYILQNNEYYSDLEPVTQGKLLEYYNLSNDDFETCEANGFKLSGSISLISSLKNSVLSITDAITIYQLKNRQMQDYIKEIAIFNNFTLRYLSNENAETYIQLLLQDGNAKAISAGYTVSTALSVSFQNLYSIALESLEQAMTNTGIVLTGDDLTVMQEILAMYPVDPEEVLQYKQSNSITSTEILDLIREFESEIAEQNGEIVRSLSDPAPEPVSPNVDNYYCAPFLYDNEKTESINNNTGSVSVDDNAISLKGKNALDLNLNLTYDSSRSNLYSTSYYYSTDEDYALYKQAVYYVDDYSMNDFVVHDSNIQLHGTYDSYYTASQVADQLSEIVFDYYVTSEQSKSFSKTLNFTYDIIEYANPNKQDTSCWTPSEPPNSYYINEDGYSGDIAFSDFSGTLVLDNVFLWNDSQGYAVYGTEYNISVTYSGTLYKSETLAAVYKYYIPYIYPFISSYTPVNSLDTNTYWEKSKLGAGWSFNLPSVETVSGNQYLHLNRGDYKVEITSDNTDSNLKDHTLKDLRFEQEASGYSNGLESSSYTLYYKNGNKDYFTSDGRLIGSRDRYGNQIKYQYTSYNGDQVLNKVIDSLNREINIQYTDTTSGREVTISIANTGYQVKYILDKITGEGVNDYKLVKKIDAENRETQYQYSVKSARFNFFDKTNRSTANKYVILDKITYPTNATTQYSYASYVGNLGDQGSEENYRLVTRKNVSGTDYNVLTYNYSNDNYSGYPAQADPSSLPSSFTYWTTITNDNGSITKYVFNNKHLPINTMQYENTIQTAGITVAYDSNKLPDISVKTSIEGSMSLQSVENFDYDVYGDLIAYWGPLALRDSNNNPTNDEFKSSMTYQSTYHYLTEKVYKKDANTTIKESYVPTTDSKGVERIETYEKIGAGSYVQKVKTGLSYDSYGNVTEMKQYLGNWIDYLSTKFSYTDNVSSRNGQFNGGYLTRKWTEGVKDADGSLITGVNGNSAGTIDENYTYDMFGNVVESKDGNGNITLYQYDLLNRITSLTYPDQKNKSWSYNDTDNSVVVTDANNNQLKYNYDGFGNLLSEVDELTEKALKTYSYDQYFRLKTEGNSSECAGQNTTYSYYADGRLEWKKISDYCNNVLSMEQYQYNDAFDLDNNGQADCLKTIKTVAGDANSPSIVSNTYTDKAGRVIRDGVMHNGQELYTTYQYDYLGNKIREKSARANQEGWTEPYTMAYIYNYAGKLLQTTDVLGQISTVEYDALGRVTKKTDNKGNIASTPYSTLYTYDNLGRVIKEELPFESIGSNIKYSVKMHYYDNNGNVVTEKVSNSKSSDALQFSQTDYAYDTRNHLIKVTMYDNGLPENYTQYYYDPVGNILRMYTGLSSPLTIIGLDMVTPGSDSLYSAAKYAYDRFNRLISMTDSLNQAETYQYDINGNMTGKTDRNGNIHSFQYDGLGRVLEKAVVTPDGSGNMQYNYTYTLTGNQLASSGGGTSANYQYDDLGRMITETNANIIKNYGYDSGNNRISFNLQNGQTVLNTTYGYDMMNRLKTLTENEQLQVIYSYDANGNRESLVYTNGDTTSYHYNLANMLLQLTNTKGSDVLSQYSYTYFLDGNQETKIDNTGKAWTYAYDDLGRLLSEAVTGEPTIRYTYDDSNNRQTMTVEGISDTEYQYDLNNRIVEETKEMVDSSDISRYYYDKNGSQTCVAKEHLQPITGDPETISIGVLEDSQEQDILLYTYDGFNQLTNVLSGGLDASYTYNANGLRSSKTVNGETINYIWDGTEIVAELDVTNSLLSKYIRGINLIFASDGTVSSYYLFNGHGDVVQLADSTGNVTKSYDYDAFGNEKNEDPADTNVFRYCGQYFDKATGTYYLRARYYDPSIGRFLAEDTHWNPRNMIFGDNPRDPLGLNIYTPDITAIMQSSNLFVYCGNNPLMWTDPTGEAWWHWAIAGGIVLGTGILTVVTAGGFAPAAIALSQVAVGMAAASTATTIAAGTFIGSSAVLGVAAFTAAANSRSVDEFYSQGNWGVVISTAVGAGAGGLYGYVLDKSSFRQTLSFDSEKLQHEYKHAADYGITGNWNNTNKAAFEEAIRNQMNSVNNPILGTYRGNTQVYHFYNPKTGVNTMIDMAGNFIGGWKLSADQIANLLRTGNIQ